VTLICKNIEPKIFEFLVASLALTKQSKTQKFKGQALAGKRNTHAGAHSSLCKGQNPWHIL
jgi:hypothetical protein